MKIKYFDERLCESKTEKGLTKAEYESRMGDLCMMEAGGHISNIVGTEESINKAAAALGRKGGSAKTPAKQAASRDNGKKGGRPRKINQEEGK